jgi:hypothetical protein
MTGPDQIPENIIVGADYFDALSNKRFSWPVIEQRRSRASEHTPERRAKRDGSEREKRLAQTA